MEMSFSRPSPRGGPASDGEEAGRGRHGTEQEVVKAVAMARRPS